MKRTSTVLVSALALAVLLSPVAAQQPQRNGGPQTAVPASPDDKTIVHVLNRVGFGPGPGDVEAVRQMGLAAYIDRQLHPERIADERLTTRLTAFTTLQLSTRELADRFYIPALMERQRRQRQQGASGEPPARAADSPEMAQVERGQRQVFAELAQQKVLRAVYSERQLE